MKKFEFLGASRATRQRHFKTSSTGDENVFRPGALQMFSKETSLDPNVAVSPEKQLSSLLRCKPGKYYTALPKLNMETFASVFRSENSSKCEAKILAVLRFELPFERGAFGFNLFGTFRERTIFESWRFVLIIPDTGECHDFYLTLEKHV